MRIGSLFSGIGAPECAWHPLGWQSKWCAEIEPFPSAVFAHHNPGVPNLGDVTKVDWRNVEPVNVLVFGSPCQSFSVAGKRLGLDDPRGNLALFALGVARQLRPEWLVFENVPGLLSSDEGRDFGAFLGLLGQCGYGFAYRVLDAQHFGVPQRRRRVFVVGHLGDWRRAAAVLFERESLSGNPAPRRETRERVADPIARGSGGRSPGLDADTAGSLLVANPLRAQAQPSHRADSDTYIAHTLNAKGGSGRIDGESETFIAHSLRAEGFDASEDGTGRGTPLVPYTLAIRGRGDSHDLEYRQDGTSNAILTPNGGRAGIGVGAIAFSAKDHGGDVSELAPTLRAGSHTKSHANAGVMPAVAFGWQASPSQTMNPSDVAPSLDKSKTVATFGPRNVTSKANRTRVEAGLPANTLHETGLSLIGPMTVRRLTPRECERLQGFPDDWTAITYRGKPAADGPRYKALGNSMAVPVLRWIGERIDACHKANREAA